MLTVKHIATDGIERLYEAERVEKVETGDRFSDGIFLDRDILQPDSVECVVRPVQAHKHVIHFVGERSSADVSAPMVYVMNRYGATVATYRL